MTKFALAILLTHALVVQAQDLEFERWSGDVNVPDPVSISFDPQGRAYVTQTQRRKAQDLDIRANRDWIPDDVGFQSIDDKKAFYHTQLAPEHSARNKRRVSDLNKDGSNDWRDLTAISEKIHLVEDTDGDGKADSIHVFAEGFQTEVTGIAAGVLYHEGTVYATIAPDVWKLHDTNDDGVADKREILATGFGLHIAYAGHDMHGLTVGPDGKIYWSVGDKGIHVTSPEGKTFHYPNQGGVMRCNPDGSDFEVFAHGLRNVQELAFDEFGNLFGVDNDADMSREKERFVYITRDSDAGWRCNYQYRGSGYNPWTAEGLWQPLDDAPGRPLYAIPPIRSYENGPCGFVYNPGTALGKEWERTFFMTEAPSGNQWAFQTEPAGASFKMINSRKIGSGKALIGWSFGPDGALYGVDWMGGYSLNRKGAIWKIDVPNPDLALRSAVQALLKSDFQKTDASTLQKRLFHADQRVRLKAQFELAKRGDVDRFKSAASSGEPVATAHAVWGLGQIARTGNTRAVAAVVRMASGNAETQIQVARTLGDLKRGRFDPAELLPMLRSGDRRVQFHAAIALGHHPVGEAVSDLRKAIANLDRNDPDTAYMIHAFSVGLAGCAEPLDLARLTNASELEQIVAVLALRHQKSPAIAAFLAAESAFAATEAARAIHDDFSIREALPALAQTAADLSVHDEAFARRAINANFRIGSAECAGRVAHLAASESLPKVIRRDALDALALWNTPPALDRVDGRNRSKDPRETADVATAVEPVLANLLSSGDTDILEDTLAVAKKLGIELDRVAQSKLLANTQAPDSLRVAALENLDGADALKFALASQSPALRIRAARMLAESDKRGAVNYLKTRLAESTSIPERQAAIATLADLKTAEADALLERCVASFGRAPAALHLDLLDAAESRNIEARFPRKADDPLGEFIECLEGGSAERGKRLAETHLAAQCIRCHTIEEKKGSEIGPNLKTIGQKDRRYLLESLVDPSATIPPGFGVIALTLKDGSTVSGQLHRETPGEYELKVGDDAKIEKVAKSKVASKTSLISLMPPMSALLNKREIRDMVEYLSTLK